MLHATSCSRAAGVIPAAASPWALVLILVAAAAACAVAPGETELAARDAAEQVERLYRPGDARPELPLLGPDSPFADFMLHALLRSPRVEAAYYDWIAAVARIAPARTPPDPRLTFSLDVADALMAVMTGWMADLPALGRLRAAAEEAAAASETAYFAFERELLRAAFDLKSAHYRLRFLDDSVRVQTETLRLLADLERLAQERQAVGRGALQDVLRAQIAREQLATQLDNLRDSRTALLAEWKAALGLGPADAEPPVPASDASAPSSLDAEALLAHAWTRNPRLRAMESDVRRAEASLELARRAGVPDLLLGLEADVKADPVRFTPLAGATLPIRRERIAAEIAAAQAERRASAARLDAEQVALAAELAAALFLAREAERNAALLEDRLLPRAREALVAAQTDYATGRADFLDALEAQRTLLEFELAALEARTRRELALATLALAVAGMPPAGAPLPTTEE